MNTRNRTAVLAAFAVALVSTTAHAGNIFNNLDKKPRAVTPDAGQIFGVDNNGISDPVFNQGSVVAGFEGISQYDVASVGRNFIPPDTIGAIGRTQYMQFVNGGVAVFDKVTGVRTSFTSDSAFWNNVAGQAGAPGGDQRVLYNAQANRWIALSFGANTKDLQIAVSDNSNALGNWKSTKFEGFAPVVAGLRTLADYPTLAMDNNAVYIGTNDFAQTVVGGATSFKGTTLNVIPLASLFNSVAPTVGGKVAFKTVFTGAPSNDFTRGFAIQGVNSRESTDGVGHIIAASINDYGITRYDVTGAGTAGATRTATTSTTIGTTYTDNLPARQPADIAANQRVIDSFGDQIGSSAFEANGRIYSVHTVTNIGSNATSVRYTVLDTATGAVLEEGNLGTSGVDHYQGSLAVNSIGQVVLSYNRSSLNPADGRITLAARIFNTRSNGSLVEVGDEIVLRVSDTNDYHNGSIFGQAAAGRQRWADYSSVTLDPTSIHSFWVTGTFAREYNNLAGGHPGGTGGSRWGTYIAQINAGAVPEPANWALMIAGFGLVGGAMRRRSTKVSFQTA